MRKWSMKGVWRMSKAILVMDMPKNCIYCPLSEWATCRITKKCHTGYERPTWCPLREVKEGEWIFKYEGTYNSRRAYCSVCGNRSGIGGIKENQMKPYCPNCGAKMKVDEILGGGE